MRKLFVMILSAMLLLGTVSAFAAPQTVDLETMNLEELQTLQAATCEAIRAKQAEAAGVEASGQLGNNYVSVKDACVSKDYEGNDCIIVTFEWSHTESEARTFSDAIRPTLYQGGIELEYAYSVDGYDGTNLLLKVKSGAVIEVQRAFILRDTSSPVEVEITDMWDFNTVKAKVETVLNLPIE